MYNHSKLVLNLEKLLKVNENLRFTKQFYKIIIFLHSIGITLNRFSVFWNWVYYQVTTGYYKYLRSKVLLKIV